MWGQAPLTPVERLEFSFTLPNTIHSYAQLGEPRCGGEHPWPYGCPIPVPFFGFLKSMISTEQKK
jgi:hypothetical protein